MPVGARSDRPGRSPNRAAAVSVSSRRAAAAAVRSGGAACGMPGCRTCRGRTATRRCRPSPAAPAPAARASSSATSSASAVRVPWPASTLPVNAVTAPSRADVHPGVVGPVEAWLCLRRRSSLGRRQSAGPRAWPPANALGLPARQVPRARAARVARRPAGRAAPAPARPAAPSAPRPGGPPRGSADSVQHRQTWPASSASILASSGCGTPGQQRRRRRSASPACSSRTAARRSPARPAAPDAGSRPRPGPRPW